MGDSIVTDSKEERARALDGLTTLCEFFQNRVCKGPSDEALREFNKSTKEWVSVTYSELGEKVLSWRKAFAALNLKRGDRVAMLLPAEAMGSSPWEIVWRVYLKEAVPGITRGVTITLVSLINFTAIAGTLGAGGLGNFAIMYGHSKNLPQITWTVILIIVVLVSIVQALGGYIAKKATH